MSPSNGDSDNFVVTVKGVNRLKKQGQLNAETLTLLNRFHFLGLEFAYSQSPADLRGVVMGVCLAMIGLGYYVAGLLASIVKNASHSKWYPDDLNDGTLEDYMFLLAGLMLINAAVFLFLAVRYRYADHAHQRNPVNNDNSEVEGSQDSSKPSSFFQSDDAHRPLINNIFCDIRNYGP